MWRRSWRTVQSSPGTRIKHVSLSEVYSIGVKFLSKFIGGVGRYRRYQQSLPRDRGGRLGHPRVLSRLRYDMLLHRGRGPESLSQGVTPQICQLEPIFGPIALESRYERLESGLNHYSKLSLDSQSSCNSRN